MKTIMTRALLFPLLLVLFLLPACREQAEAPPFDAEEARRLYGTISDHHERIMAQYGRRASEMTPEIQQRYDQMEQMYGEAEPMYRQMMHGGMMDGDMMGAGTGDMRMDWEHLHAMDRRMRTWHTEMATALRAQGYDDMADMHGQMTQYYDQALRLSQEDVY